MRKALLVSMAVFANLLIGPRASDAAIRIWTGAGGNSAWSTPGNWVSNAVPGNGDVVVIPNGAATDVGNNNLNNLTLAALIIQHEYFLSGNELTIGVNGLHVQSLPASTDTVSINVPLKLSGQQTWTIDNDGVVINDNVTMTGTALTIEVSETGELRINGAIGGSGTLEKTGEGLLRLAGNNTYSGRTNVKEGYLVAMHAKALGVADGTTANGTFVSGNPLAAGTLHIANVAIGNEALDIYGPGQSDKGALQGAGTAAIGGPITLPSHLNASAIAPSQLTFNGPIKGVGRVVLANNGTFVFANSSNTYTGGLGIGEAGSKDSKVTLAADEAIPGAPPQTIPTNTTLTLNAGITQTLKGLLGAGTLRVMDTQSLLLLTGNFLTTFDGNISGAGKIRYAGTGHQRFTKSSNSWTGQLIVENGAVFLVDAHVPFADAVAAGNGTLVLSGTAQTRSVLVDNGAALRIENGATAAAMVNTGSMEFSPDTSLRLDGLTGSGNAPGTFGRINATGTVAVNGNLVLVMPMSFTAPAGTVFTLIANDGSDPITGTFTNAPPGTKFTWGAGTYQLAYNGGDGNDVTLTAVSVARDYILSEGATGAFFLTEIVIGNPNDQPAPFRVSFLKPGGGALELDFEVPAMARKTIVANDITALDVSEFSTVVRSTSGLPLVVERTMTWDRATGYGAHTERAAEGPASKWYFAEGAQGFFSTYLLLANPNATPNEVNVQYLIEGGEPFTRTYDVPARSRLTIDAGADPQLVDRSFGMVVSFAQPGLAERAMYFGADPLWKGGHEAAGATSPSTSAYLAEGATGPFFETFVLIANPNLSPVDVNLTFGRQAEAPITMTRTIAASSRLTLNLETLDPGLANTPVSTRVEASLPVIVERAQYWPDPAPQWYEAHSSAALQTTGLKWGLAEGRVGGPSAYQTYILLANTNAADAHVSITFLRESGAPFTKSFTVPATQRLNVPVGPGTEVPELIDERFGALIVSDQPIAVERAMYSNAGGQIWAAGTSANATPLP